MLTQKQRTILEYTQSRVGTLSSVREWVDTRDSVRVPVGIATGSPELGLTSYATLGLSDFSIDLRSDDGASLRVELVGVAREEADVFLNGFGKCAINIAGKSYQPMPGRILPNVFDDHSAVVSTPHGLLWYPFAWDTKFGALRIDQTEIEWLTVIPITDSEFSLVREVGAGFGGKGVEHLLDLFEERRVDVWDLTRASAVAA